jgi:hypothetical protein
MYIRKNLDMKHKIIKDLLTHNLKIPNINNSRYVVKILSIINDFGGRCKEPKRKKVT